MGDARFTPGPWSIDTVPTSVGICHRIGAESWPTKHDKPSYACVYADHSMGGSAWPTLEANARLIAASPSLYEALTGSNAMLKLLASSLERDESRAKQISIIDDQIKKNSAALRSAQGDAP